MYRVVEVISVLPQTVAIYEDVQDAIGDAVMHNLRTGAVIEVIDDFGHCIQRYHAINE